MALILYQRDDCHLCDLALAMLARAHAPEFDSVFIDGDAALEARYGLRVPVLRDAGRDMELDWPFDAQALQALLQSARAALPATAASAAPACD
jgi:hypothetical protein